jgi:hypothetical protein
MRDALFSAMSGQPPAMPAHRSHTQIILFGAESAQSQQTEAGAHIGGCASGCHRQGDYSM